MDFKLLKEGGWFAIGVSSATGLASAMTAGDIVAGYIDRFGNGFGYVAALESTARVAPVYQNPPNVTESTIGVSQAIVGKDDLIVMEFERPLSEWGGAKKLMLSYKDEDVQFNPNEPPVAGEKIKSSKHTAFKEVAGFSFETPSTTCPLPPSLQPPRLGPCGSVASFSNQHVGGLATIDYTVDCVANTIEFTVVGDSDGWLAIGFSESPGMPQTDTYQMWLAADGSAKVQNGFATGRSTPASDGLIAGATGSRQGSTLTFTFSRALDTGNANDVKFAFGNTLYVHTSKRDSSTNPAAKHDTTAAGSAAIELFVEGEDVVTPAPTPAPAGVGCGSLASAETLVNSVAVPFGNPADGDAVVVNMAFDCAANEVEFTVSGKSNGWLAFGFSDAVQTMPGSDTYQVWLADDGTPKVRNGHAEGKSIVEDEVLTAGVSGYRDGEFLSVTFRRKFDTGSEHDRVLSQGFKYVINVARNDAVKTPTAKHDVRAWSPAAIELFEDGGPVIGGPCLLGQTFKNSVALPLAGEDVRVTLDVDCALGEVEFTVVGKTDGWLAFGLSNDNKMPATDTYQVSFDSASGVATVRNGYASGKSAPAVDAEGAAVRGSHVNGVLSVTFRRSIYTRRATDMVLHYGKPYFVHVARHASNSAFTAQHTERTPGAEPIDLFAGDAPPVVNDPCADGAATIDNRGEVEMDGGVVELVWVVDCAAKTIEFTITGETDGWLGVGFTNFADKMSGADTYQMRANGGQIEVRNGRAVGRKVVEDGLITAEGVSENGKLTATFTRALDTGVESDVVFEAGQRWFVNVARRNEDNDWTKKHDFRSWSDDSFDFFEQLVVEEPPSETEPPSGGDGGVQTGSVEVDLNGDPIAIDYTIDCAKAEIELTVTGKSAGWLAIGFVDKAQSMKGTDTYQLRIGDDGKGQVRNGVAPGYKVTEQDVFDADAASRDGDEMTVTFTRPLAGTEDDDAVLEHGSPFYINVARRADDNWEAAHGDRAWSSEAVELFVGGACPEEDSADTDASGSSGGDPCETEDKFSNTYYAVLAGEDLVELEYTVDCEAEEIVFTLKGKTDGWLAVGFNDAGKMAGSDTYQVRIDDDKAEVRNSKAQGRTVPDDDDTEVDDAEGERDGDAIEVTFKRAFDTGSDGDVVFAWGTPWHINVARRDDDGKWTSKHTARKAGGDAVELFTTEPHPNPLEEESESGGEKDTDEVSDGPGDEAAASSTLLSASLMAALFMLSLNF